MEKKTLLKGVQKKRPIIKHKKKKLLKKVLDSLISDTYMYTPLISHPPQGFRSPMYTRSSITGVEAKQTIEGKSKRLLKKVRVYLKSDSYMYGPLLAPTSSTSYPPKAKVFGISGSLQYLGKVTTNAVIKRKSILKDNISDERFANVAEDQASKGCLPEKIILEQQSVVNKETLKHMVHHSCPSSSSSGKGFLGSQLSKLVD